MKTQRTKTKAGKKYLLVSQIGYIITCLFYRLVDNLTTRQLLANAEIRLPNNDRLGTNYEEIDPAAINLDDQLVSMLPDKVRAWIVETKINDNPEVRWEKGADFDIEKAASFPNADFSEYKSLSMVNIFEKFVDDAMIDLLVEESRRYALFLNCPDPKITSSEIRCFLGILLISGYNHVPSKRHYWDGGNDMRNTAIYESMRRDRFLQICRFLHCTDNTKVDSNDKAWKVRPIMDQMKKRCIENFVPEQHLSYDESMIRYYGRHGCKQFIRGKPIRFGFKMWCLNTSSGYLVNFELYQGKGPKSNTSYEKIFGKAASPLLVLFSEISEEKQKFKYKFYMDNLFSGPALFSFLTFYGYSAIGTIRDNRLPKGCPLTSKVLFKKKNRGYFETALEKNKGQLFVRWMDNSVVTMISSSCGTQEISQAKRYSQQQKKNIMVPRPKLIAQYNKHMGGTDQMDQNVNCYRIGIRGKKWYWPILTWIFDVAIQNSWILYNKSHEKKISGLEFRREVANVYLQKYKILPKGPGRPSTAHGSTTDSRVSDEVRFDRIDHWVQSVEKKRRCAYKTCKSTPRTICSKCNVGLCVQCFLLYHTK